MQEMILANIIKITGDSSMATSFIETDQNSNSLLESSVVSQISQIKGSKIDPKDNEVKEDRHATHHHAHEKTDAKPDALGSKTIGGGSPANPGKCD